MSKERDELVSEGRKLHDAWFDGPDMEQRDRMIRMAKVAREIHQPRTITTIEELDALPNMTVVMDRFGSASNIYRQNPHLTKESHHFLLSRPGDYVVVLHEPEASNG